MLTAAMLSLIEEAGQGALVLVDGLQPEEFARSRLTRAEVCRQLRLMADTLLALPPATRASLPEIDWDGWQALAPVIADAGPPRGEDAAWFAATALVPATLSWLRLYRHREPALFSYTAG